MHAFLRTVLWSSKRLPEAVLAEFVDIIFTSMPPVVLIGGTLAAVGALIGLREHDPVILILVVLCVAVTVGRIFLILAYRRRASLEHVDDAPRWERRYAIGAYSFALVLGAFNMRATAAGDPMVAMLVTSVMFGYGAGIVARLGVRPIVCIISLGLAVVPTAIGYLTYASNADDYYATTMYAAQAVLLIAFAAAGIEAMGHIYRTTLEQLLAKQDLVVLAGHDALTGLPNRTLLRARLNDGIVQMKKGETILAFHCLDLDQFKSVNDTLGHPTGDALLKLVAERLRSNLRIGDTVARLGGDEFVILQIGISHEDEARLLAHRIVRALSAPYDVDGRELRVGVTVGIAIAPRDGVTFDRLSASADAALYQAKHRGRGSVGVAGEQAAANSAVSAA